MPYASFLEYLAYELLGPRPGSYWSCPYCGSPKFSVRPPGFRPDGTAYAIKFRCWHCDIWGDELDLYRCLNPALGRDTCILRIARLREKFEAGEDARQSSGKVSRPPLSSGGGGIPVPAGWIDDLNSEQADAALTELFKGVGREPATFDLVGELTIVEIGLEVMFKHRITPARFLELVKTAIWAQGLQAEHREDCRDPECDYACCRRARGWTDKQIREACERSRLEKIAKQERETAEVTRKYLRDTPQ